VATRRQGDDRSVLDTVLAAATSPCPSEADGYYNVEGNPSAVDGLVHVPKKPEVQAVLLRLMCELEQFQWPWWTGLTLGGGYEEARERFVGRVRELRSRLPPAADDELSSVEQDILQCLQHSAGRDVRVSDLQRAAGLRPDRENDKKAQRRACARLAELGLARRVRRGWWRSV
jgi:hypothetical protein